MIHHPKASMIGATTITKPRILPPKPPAAILPRLMEFQRLIAEGMTADAAMRQLEGSDGHKPKLPEHQISIQTGIPKPKRAPNGYDIADSAAFFNKPSLGVTVHKGKHTDDSGEETTWVELHTWKVRKVRLYGFQPGMIKVHFDQSRMGYQKIPR